MNGGTIPSNRTQYVTFFNTTGVIERHKNMYYVPRFSQNNIGVNQTVANTYYDLFQRVCPPSSVYTGIQVSSWSPEDRTLVVQGNIDDFRCITDEGECLNYVVVTRTVTKGQNTQVIYYAFFISDAKQSGGSSITLTLIPDDFTNVFYLHNNHLLTQSDLSNDYEPFNEHMKNCYVKRQHYNRFTKELDLTITYSTLIKDRLKIDDGYMVRMFDNYSHETYFVINLDSYSIQSNSSKVILRSISHDPMDLTDFIAPISVEIQDGLGTNMIVGTLTANAENLTYDNLEVFKNTDELFKFKYQYKTSKELSHKYGDIRDKLRYLVLELKGTELLSNIEYAFYNSSTGDYIRSVLRYFQTGGYGAGNVTKASATVALPFLDIEEDSNTYNIEYVYKDNSEHSMDLTWLPLATKVPMLAMYEMTKNAISDYIMSAYIVKDINLPDSIVELKNSTTIKITVNMPEIEAVSIVSAGLEPKNNSLYPVRLKTSITDANVARYEIYFNTSTGAFSYKNYVITTDSESRSLPALLISGFATRDIDLSLDFTMSSSPKTEYLEPLLELEPYSFYSISSLSFEMTLNSSRYLKGGNHANLKIKQHLNINGAVKTTIVPYYVMNGLELPYYNEGLTFTYLHTIPLVSDSYSSYYYQNQAQMKNQFAVNDFNRGVDLAQHFFVSGPNAVGMRAGKMGWVGALLETGNQLMQMLDEGIDWTQNKKEIRMNQEAKLADMGAKPDNVKQAGSDVYEDIQTNEDAVYTNHYTIDKRSYDSISKLCERMGYQVGLYDTLHVVDRVGWNYVQLNGFDYEAEITVSQEDTIRKIFSEGVTLLHDKSYLTSGHNYETILDE